MISLIDTTPSQFFLCVGLRRRPRCEISISQETSGTFVQNRVKIVIFCENSNDRSAFVQKKTAPAAAGAVFRLALDPAFVQDAAQGVCGLPEVSGFLLAQCDGDQLFEAGGTHHGGHAQNDIVHAEVAVHHRRDGQDGLLVPDDDLADALDGHCDAVVGGALLLNDLVGAVLDLLCDVLLRLVVVVVAAHLAEIVQRDAGDVGAAPGRNLAVAVLADDEGVDALAVHGQVLAQLILQAGGVQHGAGADDPVLREAGQLDGGIGQDVHRVRHHQQDAAAFPLGDLRDDALEDVQVLVHEVQPGLAGLLACACRDDDDGGIHDVIVGAGIDLHVAHKGDAVADVHGFAFGLGVVCVDQDDLREQLALHQRKGRRRADEAAANDGDLA